MLSDDDLHPLDRSSFKSYDESLSKLVNIILHSISFYSLKGWNMTLRLPRRKSSVFVMKERLIGTMS